MDKPNRDDLRIVTEYLEIPAVAQRGSIACQKMVEFITDLEPCGKWAWSQERAEPKTKWNVNIRRDERNTEAQLYLIQRQRLILIQGRLGNQTRVGMDLNSG